MKKISNIKYVDAYYVYTKDIGITKLSLHEAHGYVERNGRNIIIIFIKKNGTNNGEAIKNNENMIKGLVIPDAALLPAIDKYNGDTLNNATVGSSVKVEWRDIVYVANLPRYDCSIMYTEGTLFRIEKDHIVLKNPETIRIYPTPIKNHPEGNPATYLIIPLSVIKDLTVIN